MIQILIGLTRLWGSIVTTIYLLQHPKRPKHPKVVAIRNLLPRTNTLLQMATLTKIKPGNQLLPKVQNRHPRRRTKIISIYLTWMIYFPIPNVIRRNNTQIRQFVGRNPINQLHQLLRYDRIRRASIKMREHLSDVFTCTTKEEKGIPTIEIFTYTTYLMVTMNMFISKDESRIPLVKRFFMLFDCVKRREYFECTYMCCVLNVKYKLIDKAVLLFLKMDYMLPNARRHDNLLQKVLLLFLLVYCVETCKSRNWK